MRCGLLVFATIGQLHPKCQKHPKAPSPKPIVKSRFTLLGGKIAICRGSGPDWRAEAGARVWSPLPPGLSKESGER